MNILHDYRYTGAAPLALLFFECVVLAFMCLCVCVFQSGNYGPPDGKPIKIIGHESLA